MPYIDQGLPHAGSAEVLATGMFDEPAGTLARAIPRGLVSASNLGPLTTGGQVAARMIALPAALIVANIQVLIGGTGATGPTHFWVGITDLQLNVLAVSADQGSAAQAASTPIKLALGTPYQVTQTGPYYVLVSSSAATTAPTLAGASLAQGIAGVAPVLCGTAGTQAAPPAVGAQLGGGAVTGAPTANFAAWLS